MKNSVKHNAGKKLLAQSSESTGSDIRTLETDKSSQIFERFQLNSTVSNDLMHKR